MPASLPRVLSSWRVPGVPLGGMTPDELRQAISDAAGNGQYAAWMAVLVAAAALYVAYKATKR